MQTQQISLFDLSIRSKANLLLGNQYKQETGKIENQSAKLINPFFFSGLSVYIDLVDESEEIKAKYVLKKTGAQIIEEPIKKDNIFDVDIVVTDKIEYRNQVFFSQKSVSPNFESQFDQFLGFSSQKRQISTTNKRSNFIIINPEQIPWAFITRPLQNEEANELDNSKNQSWLSNGLPSLTFPPLQAHQSLLMENQQPESRIAIPKLNDEQKFKKNRQNGSKNKILGNQNLNFRAATNSRISSHFTGGLIVVADSTMRSAPNFYYLNSMPEIRSKPLPEGIQFISPFVSDENIAKLLKDRTQSLLANANITKNPNINIDKTTEKKESREKNKDLGRSNAAACRYCGICKKSVTDVEKHRSSQEHEQNVAKQFQLVDELIDSFSRFSYF